jgi:hypothetical protein
VGGVMEKLTEDISIDSISSYDGVFSWSPQGGPIQFKDELIDFSSPNLEIHAEHLKEKTIGHASSLAGLTLMKFRADVKLEPDTNSKLNLYESVRRYFVEKIKQTAQIDRHIYKLAVDNDDSSIWSKYLCGQFSPLRHNNTTWNDLHKRITIITGYHLILKHLDSWKESFDIKQSQLTKSLSEHDPPQPPPTKEEEAFSLTPTFEDYLNEEGKKILPLLLKLFKSEKKPKGEVKNFVAMLYALYDLGMLNNCPSQFPKKELYIASKATFGYMGSDRQTISTQINNLNSPSQSERDKIDFYRQKVKQYLSTKTE